MMLAKERRLSEKEDKKQTAEFLCFYIKMGRVLTLSGTNLEP